MQKLVRKTDLKIYACPDTKNSKLENEKQNRFKLKSLAKIQNRYHTNKSGCLPKSKIEFNSVKIIFAGLCIILGIGSILEIIAIDYYVRIRE